MVSNNEDRAFGEIRAQYGDVLILPAIIQDHADNTGGVVKNGDLLVLVGGVTDDGPMTVKKMTGNLDEAIGFATNIAQTHDGTDGTRDKGDVIQMCVRGAARVRQTAVTTIAIGAAVHLKDSRLSPRASGTSPSYGRNIGNALGANNTGLVYWNFLSPGAVGS